jgi:hypothetical protein
MPNGTLKLYNKLTNALLVSLDIIGTFNIEENLNETPSNMKVKVITTDTYREEFQVNTIAYHEDTNSWWVIKSDESTYLHTGEYEHEIALVEYLEWYAYKHLTNCAFAPNTYTLEQMLERLFDIAKLDVEMVYPTFLSKDKIMPFLSFENFTVANAIKNVGRAINAIPKMYVDTTSGFQAKLTFVNRNGLDTAIVTTLNTQFPIAYEKNTNSSDQFTTRSVSNITNAKSSVLVIAPKQGGFKNISPNSLTYVADNSKVFLPSKIDSIQWVRILPQITLNRSDNTTSTSIFTGYYLDPADIKEKLLAKIADFNVFTLADLEALILPTLEQLFQINLNDVLGTSYTSMFRGLFTLKNKFDFDTSEALSSPYNTIQKVKDKTIHWTPFTNELIMAKSFRDGLTLNQTPDHFNSPTTIATKTAGGNTERIRISVITRNSGFYNLKVPNDEVLIQVGYYPIADIKVSIDNDNDAQDEKYFNQSGKVIDALSVSKLITSHTNDSVEGTKIRNARYTSIGSLLPVGQLVSDSNQLYVISQRSIDGQVKNGNEYYNVIYTLSRNRVARSENIIADSSVISYKTPDDNLVFRNQLYKDYLELSLTDGNNDTPYLPMSKALVLDGTLAGTNFDFTILGDVRYKPTSITTTVIRHVANGSIFDLHKGKLININYQDNNVLGYRLDSTGATYVQTPIVYTNSIGQSTNFELLFLDTEDLSNAINHYNSTYTPITLIPFQDLTQVNDNFYGNSVSSQGNYSIQITENGYDKDGFEIPVFEYMLQVNDDYSNLGNVIVGNDLFSTFTGTLRYHYLINNSTRITAENANKLYTDSPPSGVNNRRVAITRTSATRMDLKLYSTFSGTFNTSPITNVGIYATDGTTVKFLFAINDYTMGDNDDIAIFINNWKI